MNFDKELRPPSKYRCFSTVRTSIFGLPLCVSALRVLSRFLPFYFFPHLTFILMMRAAGLLSVCH